MPNYKPNPVNYKPDFGFSLCWGNFAPSTLIKAGPEKPNSKESKEMKI